MRCIRIQGVVLSAAISMMLLFPRFGAAEISVLTFEQFSQKVLAHYPQLQSAQSQIDVALAQQMQANAGFWPSLNFSAGYQISEDPVNVFGMLLRQERFTSADFDLKRLNTPQRHQNFSAGVHVDVPLFDAMQTIYQTRLARANMQAATLDNAFRSMEALLVAQDAYANAMTLEKLSNIVDDVLQQSQQDLDRAKDLKGQGLILGADYYAARVLFGDFTRVKNEIARQKKAMMVLLNILMGESLEQQWVISTFNSEKIPAPAEELSRLLEQAHATRPDLIAMFERLKSADLDFSRQQATALPSVSAFGEAVNDRDTFDAIGGNNYTVGIKAQLPLFDPSHRGRVAEAKAQKQQIEHDLETFKDGISRDLAEESAKYESFRENVSVIKEMVEDAQQAVRLMEPLYSEGRKSIVELLEIRSAYLQSVQAYDKTVMGLWLSKGRLIFLTGRLSESELKVLAQGAGL